MKNGTQNKFRYKYAVEQSIERLVYDSFPEKRDIPCVIYPYERDYRPKKIDVVLNEKCKYLEIHQVFLYKKRFPQRLFPATTWKPTVLKMDCTTGTFLVSRKRPTIEDFARVEEFDYVVIDLFVRLVTEEKIKEESALRIVKVYPPSSRDHPNARIN